MKQKEVKTEQALKRLVKEFMADLTNELSFCKKIRVTKEVESDGDIYVKVLDADSTCHIMTGAVADSVFDVIRYYRRHYYMSINYHLDTTNMVTKWGEKSAPVFVICFCKYEKEEA